MFTSIRRRLTFANVASALALFIALGTSGAYATHEVILSSDIQDGEVKQADLAPGAVTRTKLGNDSVNTPKVPDNNLLGIDIKDDTLTGLDVNESQLGKVPDADTVDGLDSSQLQGAGLVKFGAGSETNASSLPVIAWLELASFQTDGDTDADGTVMICNTGSQGIAVQQSTGAFDDVVDVGFCSNWDTDPPSTFMVWSADGARSWLVSCGRMFYASSFQIRCHGVASRVG